MKATGVYDLSQVTTLKARLLTDVKIVRNTTNAGAASYYTIYFTAPYGLTKGSTIEIKLPITQIIMNPSYTAFTASYDGTTSIPLTTETSTTTYNIVNAESWLCTTANCDDSTDFSLNITNAMNPYSNYTSYNDFIINIYSTNLKLIYNTSSSITATPVLTSSSLANVKVT